MNTALLIDAIVRQTVVLIAALATSAGQRGQLSHVADQVFAELVKELRRQGLGNHVIADMFGMALRTYQSRMARLSQSRTEAGSSLWEAVLSHVQASGPLLRSQVLHRFRRDDEGAVRSVLRDLVDSGLLSRSGRADGTRYDAVRTGDDDDGDGAHLDSLVLVAVHRTGPVAVEQLASLVPVGDDDTLTNVLTRLCDQGSVERDEQGRYRAASCVIDYADRAGWEAAVFDHYQTMVSALVAKLNAGTRRAVPTDTIGGSTYAFDLTEDHPLLDEVVGFLASVRDQGSALRARVNEANAQDPGPRGAAVRVTAYVGQMVQRGEEPET